MILNTTNHLNAGSKKDNAACEGVNPLVEL
jgi:hypothetical protein